MRIRSLGWAAAFAALLSPVAAADLKAPEFHPLRVPPGKSAAELKPSPVRADEPVILEMKAQRRPDGRIELQCDQPHDHASHGAPSTGEQP
jgi:hypothetical protein